MAKVSNANLRSDQDAGSAAGVYSNISGLPIAFTNDFFMDADGAMKSRTDLS